MLDVLRRQNDTLFAGESALLAEGKEAFDLLGDTTDGLEFAMLVHASGNADALFERDVTDSGEDGSDFSGGGRVALYAIVGLLKGKASAYAQAGVAPKLLTDIGIRDEGPLSWISPERPASRSMLINPSLPAAAVALSRVGSP